MFDGHTNARVPVHTKSHDQRMQLAGKIGQEGATTPNQAPRVLPDVLANYRRGALSQGGLANFLNAPDQPVFSTKHQPRFHPPSSEQLRNMMNGGALAGAGAGAPLAPEMISPIRHAGRFAGMSSAGVADAVFGPQQPPQQHQQIQQYYPPASPSAQPQQQQQHTLLDEISTSSMPPARKHGVADMAVVSALNSNNNEGVHFPPIPNTSQSYNAFQRGSFAQTPDIGASRARKQRRRGSADDEGSGLFFGGIDEHLKQQQARSSGGSRTPAPSLQTHAVLSREEVGLLPFQKQLQTTAVENNSYRRNDPAPATSLPFHLQHVQRSQERRAGVGAGFRDETSNLLPLPQQAGEATSPSSSKFASRFPMSNVAGSYSYAAPASRNSNVGGKGSSLLSSRAEEQFSNLVTLVWQNHTEASTSRLMFDPKNPMPDVKLKSLLDLLNAPSSVNDDTQSQE